MFSVHCIGFLFVFLWYLINANSQGKFNQYMSCVTTSSLGWLDLQAKQGRHSLEILNPQTSNESLLNGKIHFLFHQMDWFWIKRVSLSFQRLLCAAAAVLMSLTPNLGHRFKMQPTKLPCYTKVCTFTL